MSDILSLKGIALLREAALAAEMLANGTNLLLKAGLYQTGIYNQSFFDISIGFERLLKLIYILNHYVETSIFPTNEQLKCNFGHSIDNLLLESNNIAKSYSIQIYNSILHQQIIEFLNDFAKRTRYYNLDYLTAEIQDKDPIKEWKDIVSNIPMNKNVKKNIESKKQLNSTSFADLILMRVVSEDNKVMTDLAKIEEHKMSMDYYNREARMLILQIIRSISDLLDKLTTLAQQKSNTNQEMDIPYLSEFFVIFRNEDKYLKRRSRLSIYTV